MSSGTSNQRAEAWNNRNQATKYDGVWIAYSNMVSFDAANLPVMFLPILPHGMIVEAFAALMSLFGLGVPAATVFVR